MPNLQEQLPLEQSLQTIGPLVPFIPFLHQPFTALTSDFEAWILHRFTDGFQAGIRGSDQNVLNSQGVG